MKLDFVEWLGLDEILEDFCRKAIMNVKILDLCREAYMWMEKNWILIGGPRLDERFMGFKQQACCR